MRNIRTRIIWILIVWSCVRLVEEIFVKEHAVKYYFVDFLIILMERKYNRWLIRVWIGNLLVLWSWLKIHIGIVIYPCLIWIKWFFIGFIGRGRIKSITRRLTCMLCITRCNHWGFFICIDDFLCNNEIIHFPFNIYQWIIIIIKNSIYGLIQPRGNTNGAIIFNSINK